MQDQQITSRAGAWGALVALATGLGPFAPIANGQEPFQAAAVAGTSVETALSPASDLARLVWNRRDFAFGDWPAGLDVEIVETLDAWRTFAERRGYRMDLLENGKVLLLSQAERNRSVRSWEERVEDTMVLIDEIVPWTAPTRAPEGALPGRILGVRDDGDAMQVLVRLADEQDRDALVHDLVRRAPELADWKTGALQQSSFLLRSPGCAAWIEGGFAAVKSQEGEGVNSLTHLMLNERFGVLPSWLEEGLGWYVENEINGRIASIPSIVGTPRHLPVHGFRDELSRAFRQRKSRAVTGAELLAWQRGSWDADRAAIAWGACDHMAETQTYGIAGMCADLALARECLDLVGRGDGSWNGFIDEEWSAIELERSIARHIGPAARSEWSLYFATGRILPSAR